MKLYFYYALHSVKNQIKKLFRSWVAIVILICIVFGVLIGLGASLLENAYTGEEPAAQEEEVVAEESEEIKVNFAVEGANMRSISGLVITAFTLGLLLYFAWKADRSGSDIFLMPSKTFSVSPAFNASATDLAVSASIPMSLATKVPVYLAMFRS